jgi:hypothetical protein
MCDQTNINFSVDKLSSLDIDAKAFSFRNNPQLNNCDIDENMPNDVNFRYYSCDELSTESKRVHDYNSFFTIHCNIRSLNANFDNLSTMGQDILLNHDNLLKFGQDILLNHVGYLTGMNLYLNLLILMLHGGVGFYINNNLNFSIRDELSISTDDFESFWVEIEIKGQANILCAVFYRPPHGSAENFMNNLNAM